MAGFSVGSLFGGISNGLKKGLQYDADFSKALVHAVQTGNTALLADLSAVSHVWLQEAADEAGIVKGNIVVAILAGSDPFSGSRKAFQDVKAKYKL